MTTTTWTTWTERIAAWIRRQFRRLLAFAIAAVAAVWSFDTLTNLAQHLGFGHLSWMFPLCIDAFAALGMDYWMTRAPAWKLGRVMAYTGIIASILGNVADWILRSAEWYAAAFGVIPPAALAAVLAVMHRNAAGVRELRSKEHQAIVDAAHEVALVEQAHRDREARKVVRQSQPRPRAIEPRNVTELTPAPTRQLPASEQERVQILVARARKTGQVPTKRDVMRELRVGSEPALRLRRTVERIVTTETIETEEGAG